MRKKSIGLSPLAFLCFLLIGAPLLQAQSIFPCDTGTVVAEQKISDTAGGFLTPLDNTDYFGDDVAYLGDVNGDGVGDIAVGASRDDDGGTNRGAVYILFLNANGTVNAEQKISSGSGGFTGSLDNSDWFGTSLTGIGDLDRDGIPDLAVGAHLDDDGGLGKGAVWILFLNSNGTVKAHQKISQGNGGFGVTLSTGDEFGSGVANIRDLDGDGVFDLAVGARRSDDGGTNFGAVYILFMNTDGTVKGTSKIAQGVGGFTGLSSDVFFGDYVGYAGDFDKDGNSEMIVGALQGDDGGTDFGEAWLVFLTDEGNAKAFTKISQAVGGLTPGTLSADDQFGVSAAYVGDLDFDDVPDLMIGAWQDDDGGSNNGAAYTLLMNPNGTVKTAKKISDLTGGLTGSLSASKFGTGIKFMADFDRDTVPEVLVGAREDNDGGTDRGAVWVLDLCGNSCNLRPEILFANDTICGGDSIVLSANVGALQNLSTAQKANYVTAWSISSGTVLLNGSNLNDNFAFSAPAGSVVQVTLVLDNSGTSAPEMCMDSVTKTFFIGADPSPGIAGDSVQYACAGDTINLMAPPGFNSYLWNTFQTTQSIDVFFPGNIYVDYADVFGCSGSDTVAAIVGIVPVLWTDQIGTMQSADTLYRTFPGRGWNEATAASAQVLPGNTDGSLLHVVRNNFWSSYVGLSNALNAADPNQKTIDYAFFIRRGQLRVRSTSGTKITVGPINVNDTLTISRIGTQVTWAVNRVPVHAEPVDPSLALRADASLRSRNSWLTDVFVDFCDFTPPVPPLLVSGSFSHPDCGLNNGWCDVDIVGGLPPYTILWNTLATTDSISDLGDGYYKVVVSDMSGQSDTLDFRLFFKTIWEGFIGSSASGDTLMRTVVGGGSWGTSGARSDNKLLNGVDGRMTHVVNSTNQYYYLGLSDADPDASQFTIDYAFFNAKGSLRIREEKTGFYSTVGTVNVGDTLVIERRISSMYYYLNGVQLRSVGVSPAETLRVDASLYTNGTTLYDVFVDFCTIIPGQKRSNDPLSANLNESLQLSVFPNPAQSELNVSWDELNEGVYRVSLIDLRGKQVYARSVEAQSSGTLRMDLSGLSAGMYFLNFEGDGLRETRKVVLE